MIPTPITLNNSAKNHLYSNFSFKTLKTEYSVPAGSYVYFYSSVFAPVKFEQVIAHEWQKKNSKGNQIYKSFISK
jgi:hypothetical protein